MEDSHKSRKEKYANSDPLRPYILSSFIWIDIAKEFK